MPFTINDDEDDVFTSADHPEAFEAPPESPIDEAPSTPQGAPQVAYIPGKGIVDVNNGAPPAAPPERRPPTHKPPRAPLPDPSPALDSPWLSTDARFISAMPPPLPALSKSRGRETSPEIPSVSMPVTKGFSAPGPNTQPSTDAASGRHDTQQELRAVTGDDSPRSADAPPEDKGASPTPRAAQNNKPPPLPPGVSAIAASAQLPPNRGLSDDDESQEATLVSAAPAQQPKAKDADMTEIARLGSLFADDRADVTPTRSFVVDGVSSGDEGDAARAAPTVTLLRLGEDGEVQARVPLDQPRFIIGREDGDIILDHDATVSPWHAQLRLKGTQAMLKDMNSLNGVYVRLRDKVTLRDGDSILTGSQRFVFRDTWDKANSEDATTETLGAEGYDDPARLMLMRAGGQCVGVYFIGQALTIGRESGELVFPADDQMDTEHARIVCQENGEHILYDVESEDGVFVAIRGEVSLENEQCFQVGRTRFRLTFQC